MQRSILVLLSAMPCLIAQAPLGPDVDAGIRKGLETTVWVNQPKPGTLPAGVSHHTYFGRQ
jgi:hypothetical protein